MTKEDALTLISLEYDNAVESFPGFNSNHEGYAVILEELDELWAEVKARHPDAWSKNMQKEAIQVAAMALRFLTDRC